MKLSRLWCSFFLALISAAHTLAEPPADAIWIDVRTPGEYQQDHLEQAVLIPFDAIEQEIDKLDIAPDTPIYLYCAAGGRAEIARQRLLKLGFTNVVNAGGFEDACRMVGEEPPEE